MRQPKSESTYLVNKQGNRSDNDAPQDKCCFVVFVSSAADFGVPRAVLGWSGGSATDFWVPEIVSATDLGTSGVAGSCFIFCVCPILYFYVNNCGSDAVLVSTTSDTDQV